MDIFLLEAAINGLVLAAKLRYALFHSRLRQYRGATADHRDGRHLYQLLAPTGLRRGASGSDRALPLPQAHLYRHRHSRHRSGPRDHRTHGRRSAAHLSRHRGARRRACRSRRLSAGAAIRRASLHRQHVRSADLHDLRAGRARQHDRRLHRRVHHQPDHRDRRLLFLDRAFLRARVHAVHRAHVRPPARDRAPMKAARIGSIAGLGVLIALPFVTPAYFLHLLIQILLWGFIYTAWSTMGRFGLVSLGHGAFMGVGAYVPALLWNYFDVTPWLGIPLGIALSALLGVIIGHPWFRLKG